MRMYFKKHLFLLRKRSGWLLLLLLLAALAGQAQHRVVSGKVTDENLEPLAGVSVKIKGSQTGTITDSTGSFLMQVAEEVVLVFSYVGYSTQEVVVKGQATLAIRLKPTNQSMGEVVVVGYGTQKKTSLTASVGTIKADDIARKPVANLSNSLGGRVAGIIFAQGSGEPGVDGANVMIRGRSSTGSSAPLVIVDGIPRDYTRLDPNSIESISVLKDAAAVAPYGMAGANGVILVTTKKGKKGAPVLAYNAYVGWQNPTVLTQFADAYQYATLFNMANDNAGQPHAYSDYALQKFRDGSDPDAFPNHKVLEELITANALMTGHNVQVSGGGERLDYYLGLNYLSQQGMWGPSRFNQYNVISKINAQVTNTTKLTLSINDRVELKDFPGAVTNNANGSIFYTAFRTPPVAPLLYSNGLPGEYLSRNVYGLIHNSGYRKEKFNVLYNQLSIDQRLPFIKGLSVKGVVAYDVRPTLRTSWLTSMPYYRVDTTSRPYIYKQTGFDGPAQPMFSESYSEDQAFTYQGYLDYQRSFGRHDISGLLVLEARNTKFSTFSAGRSNYNINIPTLNNGSSDPANISNSGSSSESKQRSIIYRVTYNYFNKYLVETSGRYDGNYYFAPGHRYGFFPSFSLGWRLSEEEFLKGAAPWLNNLKLRASYGESGALAGSPFQYLSSYSLYSNSAVINGVPTQGIYETLEPNKSITWERAKKTDLGFEASLWNGVLTLEGDYFYEKRNNMLVRPDVRVPFEYGIGIAQVNAGVMENRGVELSLGSSRHFKSGLNLGLNTNFTYARNKLLQIFETAATYDNPYRRQTGRPLGTKFGYLALGYFQQSDDKNGNHIIDASEYPVKQPWGVVRPGDLKYQDTNGDSKIDVNDMVPIGKSDMPEIIYGIAPTASYKGFDISLLFQGAANRDFWIGGEGAWPFVNAASVPITALDVWTPEHPNAANPRVTTQPMTNNTQYSSWWLHDGGYLRLKTGEMGYTLPASLLSRIKLESVRVYLSGQNLLTWSGIKNFDPEILETNGEYYPQQKVVSVGLNVKF